VSRPQLHVRSRDVSRVDRSVSAQEFSVKAGDTLSLRHVSSRDVTSAVGIFNIEFWRKLTLLSTLLTSRDLT
jgi:hypothetical protein